MSLASRQSLTILGVIGGGVNASQRCFDHGPEIDALMQRASDVVLDVIKWWPITGDDPGHLRWAEEHISRWESHLEGGPQDWSIVGHISLSVALLEELHSRVRGEKRARLAALFLPLLAVHDWICPRWDRFEAYELASARAQDLLKILEF